MFRLRKSLYFFVCISAVFVSGACTGDKADLKLFVDVNSKAPQPGYVIQYIFVVWNEGIVDAQNVSIPVSINDLQPEGGAGQISYEAGSMDINRDYHPDESEDSYFFVARTPLTDADDADEGHFNQGENTVYLRIGRMAPRDYAIWAFDVKIDEDAACEASPLVPGVITLSADNADSRTGEAEINIVCESPKLIAVKEANVTEASPGDVITYTINYSYDIVNIGGDSSRFDLRRVRIYDTFPGLSLDADTISADGEELEGVIFWQIDELACGDSGTVNWTAKVKDGAPSGMEIENIVEITSQNTCEEQHVGSSVIVTVQ
ncbi:MAG: hypothetical protein ABIJ56_05395 [Pseudomonadota bacterium]